MEWNHGSTLLMIESFTVAFFAVEYLLRIWTARFSHPTSTEWGSIKKYATSFSGIIDLKDLVLLKHSPWNGLRIRDLDISRQTIIVMVKRKGTVLVPRGDLMLLEGDHVILYSQERISHAGTIQV